MTVGGPIAKPTPEEQLFQTALQILKMVLSPTTIKYGQDGIPQLDQMARGSVKAARILLGLEE